MKKIGNFAFLSRLRGFLFSLPSQEIFWLAKSLLHFRYRKMRYFHSKRHRPNQNFRSMSHIIFPRCPQPDRVHVGKIMIVLAMFWLALRTEGGVLLTDLLGKWLIPRPSMGDRGSTWWAPVSNKCTILKTSFNFLDKKITILKIGQALLKKKCFLCDSSVVWLISRLSLFLRSLRCLVRMTTGDDPDVSTSWPPVLWRDRGFD